MEVGGMKVMLRTSTGVEIDVWRESDLFHLGRLGNQREPQTCWGEDLFEVIAELAQLDLDDDTQAAEAVGLAEQALRHLGAE
jgi:hypothetical protein